MQNLNFKIYFDTISCVAPIGIFFGRIANFINGELYGTETQKPWGVVFPKIDGLIRHPSQIYEALLEGVLLFIILNLIILFRRNKPGLISGIFLVSYGFFWTCLSTALYFFNLEIINAYTEDTSRKVQIFSFADNIVLPLTLFFQASSILILTNKRLGLSFVLGLYGIFFAISFTLMSLHFSQLLLPASGIILFYIISLFQRPYEYGLNKPAREVAYTTLSKTEKYKSTVIIDTLINRSGDASGGILFNMIISFGIILYAAPLLMLPLAGILVFIGIRIANRVEIVKK